MWDQIDVRIRVVHLDFIHLGTSNVHFQCLLTILIFSTLGGRYYGMYAIQAMILILIQIVELFVFMYGVLVYRGVKIHVLLSEQ